MVNIRLFILFQLILSSTAIAQNHLSVTGQVTDSESKQPLEYASIAIQGKGIGTISNMRGEFELHLSDFKAKDTLAISYVGYVTSKFCLCDIGIGEKLSVRLKPFVTDLASVVVSTKPYTVHTFLQDVISAYDDNYDTTPHQMSAFYRETRKENETYGYLLEAALSIYHESYKEPYVGKLTEVRVNAYDKKFDYQTNENFLGSLLMNDYIGSPYSGFFRRYSKKKTYVVEDTTYMDGTPVFVISTGQLPDWKETIFVNATDLAIIRFEAEDNYGADGNLEMVKEGKSKVSRYRYLKVVNIFRNVNGKYYPAYIRMQLDHDIYDKAAKKTERYKILDREVMINDVVPGGSKPEGAMQQNSLETQLKTYNAEFWRNYTILLRTPDQDKIATDLESKSKLEEQFMKQGPKPLKRKKGD